MGVIIFTFWPLYPLEEKPSVSTVQAAGRSKEMKQKITDFSHQNSSLYCGETRETCAIFVRCL